MKPFTCSATRLEVSHDAEGLQTLVSEKSETPEEALGEFEIGQEPGQPDQIGPECVPCLI